MNLVSLPLTYSSWFSADCAQHNAALGSAILRLIAEGQGTRTHFFAGRHENIYLPRKRLPGIDTILTAAQQHASAVLMRPLQSLQIGFWFNLMQQGDVTLPHSHDDGDELLAGVYYIQAPPWSAELVLHDQDRRYRVAAQAGCFVCFAPHIVHEVLPHAAAQPRISMGFNLGLREDCPPSPPGAMMRRHPAGRK